MWNSIQFWANMSVDLCLHQAKPVRITRMSSQIYGYCFWRVFGARWLQQSLLLPSQQHHHHHHTMALWESDYKLPWVFGRDWDTKHQTNQIKVSSELLFFALFQVKWKICVCWRSHINTEDRAQYAVHIS